MSSSIRNIKTNHLLLYGHTIISYIKDYLPDNCLSLKIRVVNSYLLFPYLVIYLLSFNIEHCQFDCNKIEELYNNVSYLII